MAVMAAGESVRDSAEQPDAMEACVRVCALQHIAWRCRERQGRAARPWRHGPSICFRACTGRL